MRQILKHFAILKVYFFNVLCSFSFSKLIYMFEKQSDETPTDSRGAKKDKVKESQSQRRLRLVKKVYPPNSWTWFLCELWAQLQLNPFTELASLRVSSMQQVSSLFLEMIWAKICWNIACHTLKGIILDHTRVLYYQRMGGRLMEWIRITYICTISYFVDFVPLKQWTIWKALSIICTSAVIRSGAFY